MKTIPFSRTPVALLSILSGIVALTCLILSVVSVDYNFDALSNPVLLLSMPGLPVGILRWFLLLDLFGYYLLLLPAVFYAHEWLKTQTPWASLLTFCGTSYVLIGSIGASILAVVWPAILEVFPLANESEQAVLKLNFKMISDLVYGGMWNLLEVQLGGIWWLGLGIMLRKEYRVFGWFTIVTGLFTFLDGVAGVFQIAALHEIALNAYLVLAIVWPVWFGVWLLRKSGNILQA